MRGRGVALGAMVFFFSAAGLWLGCGDDNPASPGAGQDSGTPSPTDSGGGGPRDTGTGTDSSGQVTCAAHCSQVKQNCVGVVQAGGGSDAATAQYETNDGCLHACSAMTLGSVDDTSGDTVGCRLYHSGAPAATLPVTHCPHSGIAGGGMCSGPATNAHGGRCGSFCKLAVALCTAGNKPFESEQDCLAKCATFTLDPTKNELTTAGDTLNCRQYHLSAAYRDPALADGGVTASANTHCPHLAPGPDAGPCH
jgi:hypothetical protein